MEIYIIINDNILRTARLTCAPRSCQGSVSDDAVTDCDEQPVDDRPAQESHNYADDTHNHAVPTDAPRSAH